MIAQGILPFKLERTDEAITPRGGLALFAELVRTLKVRDKVRAHFPRPGSNRGYEAWAYLEPLLLMLEGGGRHVEDLREIRDDRALRAVVGLRRMPSLSTFGDWLIRMGTRGVRAIVRVVEETAEAIGKRIATPDYTLDIDGTVIESEKRAAYWTYKKVKGYQPILGFLAETGVCVSHEFREGNVPGHSGALMFLKRCLQLCPGIKRLRSDSALFQADVINWCQAQGVQFTITADQNAGVKEVIPTVRDWTPLRDEEGKETDREVGTAIYLLTKGREALRLVLQRWRDPQLPLFEPQGYGYYIIATNRDDLSAEQVVHFHNHRGQVENLIKEVKIGFGMEQMTSGDFAANALWFALGVLAHNLTQAQKLLFLDPDWKTKTIATIRWQLIDVAGRLIRHGRRLVLRLAVSREKFALLLQMRLRIAAFS